jgi:hypothetical protein
MKAKSLKHLGSAAFVWLALACGDARAQFSDNFNDANDDGWTHYQPLAPFGSPGTYSFLGGGYRIQAAASTNPATLGPALAGSVRGDQTLAQTLMSFNAVGWDAGIQQSFGGFARVRDLGLGTLDGYAFTYSTAGNISVYRIDNDVWTVLDSSPVALDASMSYRFLFDVYDSSISGLVFSSSDPVNPIARAGRIDSTYSFGVPGLFVRSDTGVGTADATLDNFSIAAVPEPSTIVLLSAGALGVLWIGTIKRRRKNLAMQRRQQP